MIRACSSLLKRCFSRSSFLVFLSFSLVFPTWKALSQELQESPVSLNLSLRNWSSISREGVSPYGSGASVHFGNMGQYQSGQDFVRQHFVEKYLEIKQEQLERMASEEGVRLNPRVVRSCFESFREEPFLWQFSGRFSTLPWMPAVVNQAEDDALQVAESERIKPQAEALREQKLKEINAALDRHPLLKGRPQLKERERARLTAALDQAIARGTAVARKEAKDTIDERVRETRTEFSIPELSGEAYLSGSVLADCVGLSEDTRFRNFFENLLIQFKVGKFRPELGPRFVNDDLVSETELATMVPNRVQRQITSASGAAAKMGFFYALGPQHYIELSVHVYKGRLPYVDAVNYLTQLLSLPEQDYKAHRRWWEVDSVAQTLRLVERESYEAYVTLANVDGDAAAAAGITFYPLSKHNVVAVDVTSGREGMRGVSLTVIRRGEVTVFNKSMDASLFASLEAIQNGKFIVNYGTKEDCLIPTTGFSIRPIEHKFKYAEISMDLGAGLRFNFCEEKGNRASQFDPYVSARVNVSTSIPTRQEQRKHSDQNAQASRFCAIGDPGCKRINKP